MKGSISYQHLTIIIIIIIIIIFVIGVERLTSNLQSHFLFSKLKHLLSYTSFNDVSFHILGISTGPNKLLNFHQQNKFFSLFTLFL